MIGALILGDILLAIFGNKLQKSYVYSIINPLFIMFFIAYMMVLTFLLSIILVFCHRKRLTNPIDKKEPIFYIGLRYAID
jgi:hypothetical protein